MTELALVTDKSQIRQCISEFNARARSHRERAVSIVRQTSLWLYDEEECVFGPNKFVGYQKMNFDIYEKALAENNPKFDGNLAKSAIEMTILMGEFYGHGGMHEALLDWGEALLGTDVFDSVDQAKWKFLSLFPSRRFWAFLANPKHYRIAAAVQELTEDYWTIRDKDVEKGDRAAIWKAKGKDPKRGIVALAEVISSPKKLVLPEELKKYCINEEIAGLQRRVRVRYLLTPKIPLWLEDAPSDSVLHSLTVSRATGGSVFRIKLKHWVQLVKAVGGGWPKDGLQRRVAPVPGDQEQRTETRERLREDRAAENIVMGLQEDAESEAVGEQGYVVDSKIRKAIERAAVERAKSFFKKKGFIYIEEQGKPFDLLCRDEQGGTLFVEVKGTLTTGEAIFLTANEIAHAQQHSSSTALYIVAGLVLDMSTGSPVLSGGTETVFWPWTIEDSDLRPLTFRYRVRAKTKAAKAVI